MSTGESDWTRREFIGATAGATLLSATSLNVSARVQGANNRVRIGLIGCGTRGRQVAGFFLKLPDVQYVAAADVFKPNVDNALSTLAKVQKDKIDSYEDYRRILERKDVDAIHIATPDHWHCQILIDAMAAGKDVYVEKPLSNTIDAMVKALQAYRKSDRVVQVGTQQRSGQHFQEAAALVQSGQLGKVTQAVLLYPGSGYGRPPEPATEPPAGLNWDMFQGPAERHPYKTSRQRGWRAYWDYGGGLITDWGVHLTDVALWYLGSQSAGPLLTVGAGQYVNLVNPERDQSPDAFAVTWQYPNFLMSFSNAVVTDTDFGRQGNYFYGPRGSLLVHRQGYEIRPGRQQNTGGRGGAAPAPLLEFKRVPYAENYDDDPHTLAHARNFLDCVKSRQKPVSHLEVGFYASLPCVLGVMAVRAGRAIKWDDKELKATTV
jgi:predicted dehydrogenase